MNAAFNAIIRGVPASVIQHFYNHNSVLFDFLVLFPLKLPEECVLNCEFKCELNPALWLLHVITYNLTLFTPDCYYDRVIRQIELNLITLDKLTLNYGVLGELIYKTSPQQCRAMLRGYTYWPFTLAHFHRYGFRLIYGMVWLRKEQLAAVMNLELVHQMSEKPTLFLRYVHTNYTYVKITPGWGRQSANSWLVKIVEYLEVSDRSEFRLVCTSWKRSTLVIGVVKLLRRNIAPSVEHLIVRRSAKFDGCERFTNLRQLEFIDWTTQQDLAKLKTLLLNNPRLTHLSLGRHNPIDVSTVLDEVNLNEMTSLISLDLGDCEYTLDYTRLTSLKHLTSTFDSEEDGIECAPLPEGLVSLSTDAHVLSHPSVNALLSVRFLTLDCENVTNVQQFNPLSRLNVHHLTLTNFYITPYKFRLNLFSLSIYLYRSEYGATRTKHTYIGGDQIEVLTIILKRSNSLWFKGDNPSVRVLTVSADTVKNLNPTTFSHLQTLYVDAKQIDFYRTVFPQVRIFALQ